MSRWQPLLALSLCASVTAFAQEPAPTAPPAVSLTLQEALQQGRAHNPTYRQSLNNEGPAGWAVKNAYGAFVPSATVSGGFNYTGSGSSNFGGTNVVKTSASVGSSYSIGLDWALDTRILSAPGEAKANQRATQEEMNAANVQLQYDITTQYLTALQATAQVGVVRRQVQRNQTFLDLAKARYEVGQTTLLDVRQAEVTKGQSDVDLLRAVQAENDGKLELFRQMGIIPTAPIDQIALTDTFPVTQPAFHLDSLLALAEDANPSLKALRERESASGYAVTAAKGDFLPSLRAQAIWGGYTQEYTDPDLLVSSAYSGAQGTAANCQFQNDIITRLTSPMPYPNGGVIPDCNAFAGLNGTGSALDPAVEDGIRTSNDVFPWDFTSNPFQVFVGISWPIVNGFTKERRLSEAKAAQDDAEEQVRFTALQVRTLVHSRFLGLDAAYRGIEVASANREAAGDQLRLAQDRYRLGSGTALELSDAENNVQRAEGDYVNAVYAYHKAVAALEAAVGRPLR
ncbi:MAG TPA: TolC family protein [Gemmatimonadales bacterium]|nr:TolC family protein [Gemmatimonadales bacterium]